MHAVAASMQEAAPPDLGTTACNPKLLQCCSAQASQQQAGITCERGFIYDEVETINHDAIRHNLISHVYKVHVTHDQVRVLHNLRQRSAHQQDDQHTNDMVA